MEQLIILKARAFDLIRQIEIIGSQLQQIQNEIQNEEQKLSQEQEVDNANTQ
jgi:hypothetical protein